MKRFIITVVGHDAVGIIAKVCGYFNMMMIVDAVKVTDVTQMSGELAKLGEEIGVVIHCQHEDIFNMMHRI